MVADPGQDASGQGVLLDGLTESAREFLLQFLLYKSVFVSPSFRSLVERETSEPLRELLLRISDESGNELGNIARLVHEWDRHPGTWDHVSVTVDETRVQLLHDLIRLKEGMTEAGLVCAMRAPTASLRARFLRLVDVDRRHGDALREFLGKTTTTRFRDAQAHGLGAHDAHDRRSSLDAEIRARLARFESKGAKGRRLILSPDGLRHLRDEGVILQDGRWRGLPIDIDLGWEGDVYAIQTDERLTYAELLVATARAEDEGE